MIIKMRKKKKKRRRTTDKVLPRLLVVQTNDAADVTTYVMKGLLTMASVHNRFDESKH